MKRNSWPHSFGLGLALASCSAYALPPMTVTQAGYTTNDFNTVAVMVNNEADAAYSTIPSQGQYVTSRLYDGPTLDTRLESLDNLYVTAIDETQVYGYDNYYSPSILIKCNMDGFALQSTSDDALTSSNCSTLPGLSAYTYLNQPNGYTWNNVVRYGNRFGAMLAESTGTLPNVVLPSGATVSLSAPPNFTVTTGTLVTPIDAPEHPLLMSMYNTSLDQDQATSEYVWYQTPSASPTEISLNSPIAIMAANGSGQSLATSTFTGGTSLLTPIDLLLCDIYDGPSAANDDCNNPTTVAIPNLVPFTPYISSNGLAVVHTVRTTSAGLGIAFDGVLFDYTNPTDQMTAWEILGESAPADNTLYTMGPSADGRHLYINRMAFVPATGTYQGSVYLVSIGSVADNYDVTLTFDPAGQWRDASDVFTLNADIDDGTGPYQNRFIVQQLTPVNQTVYNSGWISATQDTVDLGSLGATSGATYNVTVTTRDNGNSNRLARSIKRLNIN